MVAQTRSRASVIAPSFTQSRRLRTTCPRTPVFARSKRSVTRESPVKRVTQARPAERLISTRTSAPNRQERCANTRPRIALDDLPTIGSNRPNANKIVAPTVQGITRKPSAIVKIPNFEKAHRAAEVKVKRTPPRVTRPDCGKTPGRTSRARMIERAEFDKANREYQQRREDALKRFKQEKEVSSENSMTGFIDARSRLNFHLTGCRMGGRTRTSQGHRFQSEPGA